MPTLGRSGTTAAGDGVSSGADARRWDGERAVDLAALSAAGTARRASVVLASGIPDADELLEVLAMCGLPTTAVR